MHPVLAIFVRLGGPSRVATIIGVTTEHSAQMRRRRSIPVRYWNPMCEAETVDGGERVTYAELVAAHEREPRPVPAQTEVAA